MQLDYIWTPRKNIYAKLSGGIFEDMFGGVGGQILFKPFESNFNVSLESFYVNKEIMIGFSFKKYKTFTGHLNFGYMLPLGIESNISFGRYLLKMMDLLLIFQGEQNLDLRQVYILQEQCFS